MGFKVKRTAFPKFSLDLIKFSAKGVNIDKMVFSWFSSNPAGQVEPEVTRSGYECAPYSVLEHHEDYQVRQYPSKKWATVTFDKSGGQPSNENPMSKNYRSQPQSSSFMKLFAYISGTNQGEAKISMTVPVSTLVVDGKEHMGFYVPEQHQEDTPKPHEDQEVKIVQRPDLTAFVRQFGGFAKDEDWEREKEALKKSLEGRDDFDEIDFDQFYRQGYDAPFKFWNRKNEVFFAKKATT